jgi:hypothetical protein
MWLYELVYVLFINNIMRKQCFEQQWCFVSIDELPNDHMASHQKTDLASKGNSSNSPQNRVSTFHLMAPPLLKALSFWTAL